MKKDYYGSGAYDFRDVSLNQLGEALLVKGKAKDVAAIPDLNVEFNPQSSGAHYRLAEACRSVGELEMARKNYEKTLEPDPHYDRAKARLDELSKGPKAGTVPRCEGTGEVRQRGSLPGILRQDPRIAESVVCRARLDRETLQGWLIQYCI